MTHILRGVNTVTIECCVVIMGMCVVVVVVMIVVARMVGGMEGVDDAAGSEEE